jgi:hypothetical protein
MWLGLGRKDFMVEECLLNRQELAARVSGALSTLKRVAPDGFRVVMTGYCTTTDFANVTQ